MFATLLKKINDAKLLPKISDTERQALEAGSVWIDGEFFGGNPDFQKIMAEAYPGLSAEEQAFLDGPVEELVHMVDSWQLRETRRIPEDVWQFLRENWLGDRIFDSYEDILDQCCEAWNKLVAQPWMIMSLGLREWAYRL